MVFSFNADDLLSDLDLSNWSLQLQILIVSLKKLKSSLIYILYLSSLKLLMILFSEVFNFTISSANISLFSTNFQLSVISIPSGKNRSIIPIYRFCKVSRIVCFGFFYINCDCFSELSFLMTPEHIKMLMVSLHLPFSDFYVVWKIVRRLILIYR